MVPYVMIQNAGVTEHSSFQSITLFILKDDLSGSFRKKTEPLEILLGLILLLNE